MITKDNFINYKLINFKEETLYNSLELIYNNPKIDLKQKQKKVEKLMNVFLLKKKENIFEMNPLWHNLIQKEFLFELDQFHILYNKILLEYKIKENKNPYIWFLCNNIDSTEILSLVIYSFLHDLKENFYKEQHKLIEDFKKNLINFYDHHLKFVYLSLNKDLFLENVYNQKLDYKQFLTHIENKYKEKRKDFVLTYNIIILEYYKLKYPSLDKRYKLYKEKIQLFTEMFHENKSELNYEITKFINILIEYIFDKIKIFDNFRGKIGKKSYNYMHIYDLKIFNNINSTYYLLSQIPMISKPLNWNRKGKRGGYLLNKHDILPLTKKLNTGFSNINYSKYFLDSINLIQQKKYIIDEDFLNYIQTPLFKKNNEIISESILYENYCKLEDLRSRCKKSNIRNYIQELLSLQASKEYKIMHKEAKKDQINNLKTFFNLEDSDITLYSEYKEQYKTFYTFYNNYKQHSYIIHISKLLLGFDLYIPNKTDFRGRFYPIGRILHRTSGIYKNLLIEKESVNVNMEKNIEYKKTFESYITMLYKPYDEFNQNQLLNWFHLHILLPLLKNKKKIDDFTWTYVGVFLERFKNNVKDYQNLYLIDSGFIKSFSVSYITDKYLNSYISNLMVLVFKAKNKDLFLIALSEYFSLHYLKKHTNLLLDFDQSSSGPMIYSILSKDKNMGYLTNLLSKNNKKDLYNHFLLKFLKNFQYNSLIDKKIFTRNNFSKLLIMPIFYNMGNKGIRNLLLNLFKENDILKDTDYLDKIKIITELIDYINNLLEENYKETILFQKALVKICHILKEKEIPISFYTLDGTFISYKYLSLNYVYGSIKKNKKRKTYRIYLPLDIEANKLDNRHYLTFPPNFIQSLDGSVCRIILYTYYLVYEKIIEPLHDSFRVNLYDLKSLKNIIKYVYLYLFFNDYFLKYKIGINKQKNLLEKNSTEFLNYKKYFIFNSLNNYKNIIYDYFISTLPLDLENKKYIQEIYEKEINQNPNFKDSDIDKILYSDFIYYF